MNLAKKEAIAFLKFWLMLSLSFLIAVLSHDLARYGWIDLRFESLSRLLYVPIIQAIFFSAITYRLRYKSSEN
jgi:hypothetical protein